MKNIVIKISSNLLKPELSIDIVKKLAREISDLNKNGYKVIIVTSGAVMHGLKTLGLDKKPTLLPMLQSTAAIGQIKLMTRYQEAFEKYKLNCAQILVSVDDFKIRKRFLNLRNTLESLLEIGAIPVFNENDSINTEELKFGDNDSLSSLITIMVDFDLLIILSDVDGFYDKDPKQYKNAKLLSQIDDLNEDYMAYASSKVSKYSSGGMKKKIEAALKCKKAGIDVFIGHGLKVSIQKILENNEIGTYIKGEKIKTNARKKWLGLFPTEKGSISIDEGAYRALKNNSSLLASGIIKVLGDFEKGSLVDIIYAGNKIAQGLTNYSSKEVNLIKGKKSNEFHKYLESYDYSEVIHKNNLYLIK
jgi:glutamate 5-kinase